MYKPTKLTGIPLEYVILNYNGNIYNGEINYLGIVKNNIIGQSAAKYPNYFRIKVQRLSFLGVESKLTIYFRKSWLFIFQ